MTGICEESDDDTDDCVDNPSYLRHLPLNAGG